MISWLCLTEQGGLTKRGKGFSSDNEREKRVLIEQSKMKVRTLLILSCVLVAQIATTFASAPDRALLALDRVIEGDLVQSINVSVTYTIHNVGTRYETPPLLSKVCACEQCKTQTDRALTRMTNLELRRKYHLRICHSLRVVSISITRAPVKHGRPSTLAKASC